MKFRKFRVSVYVYRKIFRVFVSQNRYRKILRVSVYRKIHRVFVTQSS